MDVHINGRYAYIARRKRRLDFIIKSGLDVIDISNSSSPELIGSYDIDGLVRGVQIIGQYAYMVSSKGLNILDISNPSTPVLVGSYANEGAAYGVKVKGRYAYVDVSSGLIIIDISNPSTLTVSGRYQSDRVISIRQISGNYIYTEVKHDGLKIIDISEPSSMRLVAWYSSDNPIQVLQVSDSYIYGTHSDLGLMILDKQSIIDNYQAIQTYYHSIVEEAESAFINHFYLNILNRTAEQIELDSWLIEMRSNSAAKIALRFFNSQEFINLQLSDSDFIYILYDSLLDRLADQQGYDAWMEKLGTDFPRELVIYGFLRGREFQKLTDRFRGVAFSEKDNKLFQIKHFVQRLYQLILNREPDEEGFNRWTSQLLDPNGVLNGEDIARAFFQSSEFINRLTTDSEFLDIAYLSLFDRKPDKNGLFV